MSKDNNDLPYFRTPPIDIKPEPGADIMFLTWLLKLIPMAIYYVIAYLIGFFISDKFFTDDEED